MDASGVARRLIDYTRPVTTTGQTRVAVDRVVRDLAALWPLRYPRVTWKVTTNKVPSIRGNVDQLCSMLGHLVQNAAEALPPTGGTISVTTSVDERGWVVLEVDDTGSGISAATLQRAVEPFFTTKPGHLGVGLSIANGIWRRHRGTLAIISEKDAGFRIRLCVDPVEGGLGSR